MIVKTGGRLVGRLPMLPPPEIVRTRSLRVMCDGSGAVDPALGHPRVYLHIDDNGFVDCGYCDRRFILEGGPADVAPPPEAS